MACKLLAVMGGHRTDGINGVVGMMYMMVRNVRGDHMMELRESCWLSREEVMQMAIIR